MQYTTLTQHAHQAPPATQTCAHWQPYSTIQSFSAYSSPAGCLHTPASSVPSAFPTPKATRLSTHGLAMECLCSIPVPCSMFNTSFIFNVKALNFMLRLSFYTLMVAPSSEVGSPALPSLGRDSPTSELDCHHNS